MRITFIAIFGLIILIGCNRNTSLNNKQDGSEALTLAQEYKPDPDEVVISAKLISYQDGMASVEVVEQIATGFGARIVLNPGDRLSLSTPTNPSDSFKCAFEYSDAKGDNKSYRITRFLK